MPPNALLLYLLHHLHLLLEVFNAISRNLLLLLLNLPQRSRLVKQGKFFDRLFLLTHYILQTCPFLCISPAPCPFNRAFIFEVILVLPNNLQILLALKLISRTLQFLLHLLAKTITVPNLGRDCPELSNKLNLKKVGHGLKANEQFTSSMPLYTLDKEIPLLKLSDDCIEVSPRRKGDHQPHLFRMILNQHYQIYY